MTDSEWLYIVKTDSPTAGKGVSIWFTIGEALDDAELYVTRGIPVRIERAAKT